MCHFDDLRKTDFALTSISPQLQSTFSDSGLSLHIKLFSMFVQIMVNWSLMEVQVLCQLGYMVLFSSQMWACSCPQLTTVLCDEVFASWSSLRSQSWEVKQHKWRWCLQEAGWRPPSVFAEVGITPQRTWHTQAEESRGLILVSS